MFGIGKKSESKVNSRAIEGQLPASVRAPTSKLHKQLRQLQKKKTLSTQCKFIVLIL